MTESYIEKDFSLAWTETDNSGLGDGIQIALDSEFNSGLSTFAPGTDVGLVITRNPKDSYTMESSAGSVHKAGGNIPIEITENIIFANSDSEDISNAAEAGSISYEWEGTAPAGVNVRIIDNTISLSAPVVGILSVSYIIMSDTWILRNVSEAISVLVVAAMGNDQGTLTVSFDGDSLVESPCAVEIIGCFTGNVMENVNVSVNGDYQGATDSDGLVDIGTRTIGETLDFFMTGMSLSANSDVDGLPNDSAIV